MGLAVRALGAREMAIEKLLPVLVCIWFNDYVILLNSKRNPTQKLTRAGAGNAFAGIRQKKRAVCCATQEFAVGIHKIVGQPVQGHTHMRTLVEIDKKRLQLAHDYIALRIESEPPGAAVRNIGRLAEGFHIQAWTLASSPRSRCCASLTSRILRSGGRSFQ
jgi:hypothetical protein